MIKLGLGVLQKHHGWVRIWGS